IYAGMRVAEGLLMRAILAILVATTSIASADRPVQGALRAGYGYYDHDSDIRHIEGSSPTLEAELSTTNFRLWGSYWFGFDQTDAFLDDIPTTYGDVDVRVIEVGLRAHSRRDELSFGGGLLIQDEREQGTQDDGSGSRPYRYVQRVPMIEGDL